MAWYWKTGLFVLGTIGCSLASWEIYQIIKEVKKYDKEIENKTKTASSGSGSGASSSSKKTK